MTWPCDRGGWTETVHKSFDASCARVRVKKCFFVGDALSQARGQHPCSGQARAPNSCRREGGSAVPATPKVVAFNCAPHVDKHKLFNPMRSASACHPKVVACLGALSLILPQQELHHRRLRGSHIFVSSSMPFFISAAIFSSFVS